MTSIVAVLAVLGAPQQGGFAWYELAGVTEPGRKTALRIPYEPLPAPKRSPLIEGGFHRTVTGMAQLRGQFVPRFRVFRQQVSGKPEEDVSAGAARLLLRLWEVNYYRLRLDHSLEYQLQTVDAYLCDGGKPGGEHRFTVDKDDRTPGGSPAKVNTVHIYDVGGLTKPAEWFRELAHEYGHATLPPVRVEGGPETWANGDLGERLYAVWMLGLMREGKASPADAMGASAEDLEAYVEAKVRPLVGKVASNGPDAEALAGHGQAAYDAYLGLACHAQAVLPPSVFARSLVLADDQSPGAYLRATVAAAEEAAEWTPRAPAGKASWLPLGRSKLRGGTVIERRDGWAKVRLSEGAAVFGGAAL
jgi:hypothetical protein